MTIQEALKGVSNYPVPPRTIQMIAVRRGLLLTHEAAPDIMSSRDYRFAEADVMTWLASAPTISEGGVSFGFSQSERDRLRGDATRIYSELGERSQYGYKGENL